MLVRRYERRAWRHQPAELNSAPLRRGTFEQEEWRHGGSTRGTAGCRSEDGAQDLVATPGRVMKLVSWSSIVPEVGKGPGCWVKDIRPVLIYARGVEDHEPDGSLRGRARIPEASLITYRKEDSKRIVANVPSGIAEIDLLDEKIARGQLIECYRCWHLSKVAHMWLRLATRCQTQPLATSSADRREIIPAGRGRGPGGPGRVCFDHHRRICAGTGACRPPKSACRTSRSSSQLGGRRSGRARVVDFTVSVGGRIDEPMLRALRQTVLPNLFSALPRWRRFGRSALAHSYRERIASCRRLATVKSSERSRSRVRPRVLIAWQFGHSAIICSGWSGPSLARSWM